MASVPRSCRERQRVLARREQVSIVDVLKRSIWSVLSFANHRQLSDEDAIPPSDGSNSRRATVDLEVLPARILGETYERIFNRSMVEKELVHRTRREKWRC